MLWKDSFHLDANYGEEVFELQIEAIEKLMGITKRPDYYDASEDDVAELVKVIEGQILEADKSLSKIVIEEAENGEIRFLEKAEECLSGAVSDTNEGRYNKAVEFYFKAWEAALKAVGIL